jgi:superfamily I DNA/RNA helicase
LAATLIDCAEPIEFTDFFADDSESRQRLEVITGQFRANDFVNLFDYTPDADEHQRRFIDSEAMTMRLLAPAGSGKTQSIVNRVLTRIGKGEPLERFLILTFDNAASDSIRQKFSEGLAAHQATGTPQVFTLNAFGYSLFRGLLADRLGGLRLGENSRRDQYEAVRRSLGDLQDRRPDVAELLPKNLAYKVYLDVFGALKNNLILPDQLLAPAPNDCRKRFFSLCETARLLDPWLEPLWGSSGESAAKQNVVSALAFLYHSYSRVMRSHGHIDFDDQKLLPYLAFAEDKRLARGATSRFRSVIVDEFQELTGSISS